MIRESIPEGDENAVQVEVLSNLSLTLDRLAGVFLMLSGVTLLTALMPTLLGYWPVMAIAIVHLVIVGWCFRLAWRGHWARQDITVDSTRVSVESRTARSHWRREWPVDWVRVHQDSIRGEPRIRIGLHGHLVEIGRFLPADERIEAGRRISALLAPHTAWSRADEAERRPQASSERR